MADSLQHRSDIDGLRAVAVLSVVAYHAFPKLLRGGFVGVDVFFVISGYLIGSILLKGMDAGTFSFSDFYARRIRRIFPALIVVLAFCLAVGWRLMLPDEYRSLAEQAGAGAASFANVLLWAQTGYFDPDASLKPLLHLWSLGVEEQFYIVWPLILFIAYRRGYSILSITIVLAALSFALNVQLLHEHPAATFFLPHSRIWELLLGCLLAHASFYHPGWMDRALCRVIYRDGATDSHSSDAQSIVGVLLIVIAAFFLDSADLYPGWAALLPTIGAALLLSAGPGAIINKVILSNRAMVWVGVISYPLYLWHWPLLSFARIYESSLPSTWTRLVLVGFSFVLAAMTYWLVEKRVRYRRHRIVPAILAVAMALVGGQSFATYRADGYPARTARFEKVEKAVGEWAYPGQDMTESEFEGIRILTRGSSAKGRVLFFGDSNVEQYWPRVDQLITTDPGSTKSAVFVTWGGCAPIPSVEEDKHPLCTGWPQKVLKYAGQDKSIDTVVIAASWAAYLHSKKTYMFHGENGVYPTYTDPGRSYAIDSLEKIMASFRDEGKRVVLVLNIPEGPEFDPRLLVSRSLFGFSVKEGGMQRSDLAFERLGLEGAMRNAAREAGASVIDPTDLLCSNGVCGALMGDDPIYKDAEHLRPTFVREHATFIDQTVLVH